jgi:hypothetical protein
MIITKDDSQYDQIRDVLKTIKEFVLIHPEIQIKLSRDMLDICDNQLHITVVHKSFCGRGYKAHKIIDLTDDEVFHNCIALPMLIRYRN